MKNISLTISPFASGYTLAPTPPMALPSAPKQVYSVGLSVQFDNEADAMKFATKLINVITGDAE